MPVTPPRRRRDGDAAPARSPALTPRSTSTAAGKDLDGLRQRLADAETDLGLRDDWYDQALRAFRLPTA